MLERGGWVARLEAILSDAPAAVVLGARQVGKSTLVRVWSQARPRTRVTTFDLERPSDLERLRLAAEADLALLNREPGVVCVDEVQRLPELFPLLRVLLDDPRRKARWVLLGSASPALARGSSESLAGRIGFVDLTPFLAAEIGGAEPRAMRRLWARGGFPRSFLARSEKSSLAWREDYTRTFVERDVPTLGLRLPAPAVLRLLTMLAHVHGGILNASEIGSVLGVSHTTVTSWVDVLEGTFLVRRLHPFFANVGKRLVKSPKVYLRDSGLLHALLGLHDARALLSHPKAGASWEGFVLEQILGALVMAGVHMRPWFWRTHAGAEVDLLLEVKGQIVAVEVKPGADARPSAGLASCMKDLDVARAIVLHGGTSTFPVADRIIAMPATIVAEPAKLIAAITGARARPVG